ncbi:MAG: hypothetical protein SGJ03_04420 [Alphaproteobacteria bacterium]|nr:hypothetical protein [Alphaproteobacteria bacterium]
MLHLTQLSGFASHSAAADVTPDPITIPNIADAGFVASAQINTVTITGIDASVTLRLTLSAAMSPQRTVDAWRDGTLAGQGTAGSTIDVTLTNTQTLHYTFTNATDLTTWSGTATLTNLTDANTVLASFTFNLQDTGSGGGGGGGGGGEPP